NNNKDIHELSKNELQQSLVQLQQKLKKIINVENKLSNKYPINVTRLKKQTDKRLKTMNDLENIALALIDSGETFKIKRKKKINKSERQEN
ncbi:MAG: hypothetical protein OEV44_08175, partial [Spirochaetota bacterium]|nr:hypothetical protein [Spirochaetota bacterium]